MSDTSISIRIRNVRKLLKLNQTEFSEELGITQTSVSQIEREKNGISYDVFKALVNKMGVNPYWLMNGTGSIFSPIAGYSEDRMLGKGGAISAEIGKQGNYELPIIDESLTHVLIKGQKDASSLALLPHIIVPWKDSRVEGLMAIQYSKSNMMPNIYPHDWLLCTKSTTEGLIVGKLYLFIINNQLVLGAVNSIKNDEVGIKFETGVIKAQRMKKTLLEGVYEVKMRVSNMLNNVHDFMRDEINQIKEELKRLESVKKV